MIEYPAESAGIQVIAAIPFHSAQACSGCRNMVPKDYQFGFVNTASLAGQNPFERYRAGVNVSRWREHYLISPRLMAAGTVTRGAIMDIIKTS